MKEALRYATVGFIWLGLLPGCRCESKATIAQSAPAASAATASPAALLDAPVHLPPSLGSGQKAPLIVLLHGLGSSGDDLERGSDWPSFAASHGVAWVAPNGPKDHEGRRFWNAGASCCNFDHVEVDHVAALRALIERALTTQPLDRARVFVAGYSNGGFMAHRLACEAPDLVSGIASLSGAGPLQAVTCRNAQALRVLQIHGDADAIVSIAGGHLFGETRLPEHASAEKTVGDWVARLGCSTTPKSEQPFDFDARLPGPETRITRFPDCRAGRVELWTVGRGDHFVGFRSPAPEAIWRFWTE